MRISDWSSDVCSSDLFSALAQKKISFKFDSYISETAGPSGLVQWFLTELEKRSGGRVNVRRYWAGSLNKVGEHLSAGRDNTSEMSLISPGYYPIGRASCRERVGQYV